MGGKEGRESWFAARKKIMKWSERKRGRRVRQHGTRLKFELEKLRDYEQWWPIFTFCLPFYTFQGFNWGISKLHIFKIYNLISFDIQAPMKQSWQSRQRNYLFLFNFSLPPFLDFLASLHKHSSSITVNLHFINLYINGLI